MGKRLVFLTGFMGSGKTTVGKRLASSMGVPFFDCDAWIEKRAGMDVHRIFAHRGEPYFRALERAAILALAKKPRGVIALGGGALLDPRNRAVVERRGALVALRCAEPELWRRVKPVLKDRPLLVGPGARGRMRALLSKRRAGYAHADLVVSTTRRPPLKAAALIIRRLG